VHTQQPYRSILAHELVEGLWHQRQPQYQLQRHPGVACGRAANLRCACAAGCDGRLRC
jgi:hypothetical protein